MAKHQTRRSISINGQLFDAAQQRATALNVPLSSFNEHALRRLLADNTLTADAIAVVSVQQRIDAMKRTTERLRAPKPPPPGLVERAADFYLQNDCVMQTAADRFGVTRQAVQQVIAARNRGRR